MGLFCDMVMLPPPRGRPLKNKMGWALGNARLWGLGQRPANLGKNVLVRSRQQLALEPACFTAADHGAVVGRRDRMVIHDLDLLLVDPREDVKEALPPPRPDVRRQT